MAIAGLSFAVAGSYTISRIVVLIGNGLKLFHAGASD